MAGGYLSARPLREPEWLVRANFGMARPQLRPNGLLRSPSAGVASFLTHFSARHAVPLRQLLPPHASLLIKPQGLPLRPWGTARRALGEEGRCLVGWGCFSPVTSRVSPRRASEKKVTTHVRALRVPCANSGHLKLASLKQCKCLDPNAAPLLSTAMAGGYLSLVRFADLAPVARPLRELRELGFLIPHASLLSRARHAVPLRPNSSLLIPHFSSWATTRVAPTPLNRIV